MLDLGTDPPDTGVRTDCSVNTKNSHFIMFAVVAIVGFGFICVTMASITSVIIGSTSRAVQYQEKVRMVMSDLKALQVPSDLRSAAKNYYDTLWRVKNTSDRYEKAIYEVGTTSAT